MSDRGVSYRKELLDYAKKHKKFLVTVDVYTCEFVVWDDTTNSEVKP